MSKQRPQIIPTPALSTQSGEWSSTYRHHHPQQDTVEDEPGIVDTVPLTLGGWEPDQELEGEIEAEGGVPKEEGERGSGDMRVSPKQFVLQPSSGSRNKNCLQLGHSQSLFWG